MLRSTTRALVLLCLLMVVSSACYADGFCAWVNPPPAGEPGFTRDLQWTFEQDPWQTPNTHTGPIWDEPGTEWTCDDIFVDSGLVVARADGALVVSNSTASVQRLRFHVNNYDRCRPVKWLWAEALWGTTLGTTTLNLLVPEGFTVTKWIRTDQTHPAVSNWDGEIQRNPIWEEFSWELDPYSQMTLYDFHIHTVCVPEPSSLLALVGGLGAIGGMMRRRRS